MNKDFINDTDNEELEVMVGGIVGVIIGLLAITISCIFVV